MLTLLAPLPLAAAAANDGGLAATRARLARRLPHVSLESLHPSKVMPGWYELAHGMNLIYVSPDAKHMFVGDLIDLETQRNLTEAWRNRAAQRMLNAVGEENMIVMGPKHARRTITVFTDVDCPYCAKLHQEVPALNRRGVRVRYLMFPRAGLDSETYRRSVAVWCAADRVAAFDRAESGGRLDMKTCPNPVAQQYRLGLKLGVEGTPTIFFDDGTRLGGYLPSARLLAMLKLKPDAAVSDVRRP